MSKQTPSNETVRDKVVFWTETMFTAGGFILGIFAALFIFKTGETFLGNPHLSFIGWSGCLEITPIALGFVLCIYLFMLLGWWLWLCIFARPLAVTKHELYLLATGPQNWRLIARLPLRIAGVSKAEEEQFRKNRKKRL